MPKPVVQPSRCEVCIEAHVTHNPLPREGAMMERISDLIGSVRGIWMLAAAELVYMLAASTGFDRYPFPFLTLVLSLIALQFSQIIIVVQNRQGALLEAKQRVQRETVARDYLLDEKALAMLDTIINHLGCAGPETSPGTPPPKPVA